MVDMAGMHDGLKELILSRYRARNCATASPIWSGFVLGWMSG